MARVIGVSMPPGPERDLRDAMLGIHDRAGRPSTRWLAKNLQISHTTVHNILSGARRDVPVLQDLQELVEVMASFRGYDVTVDLVEIEGLWHVADGHHRRSMSPPAAESGDLPPAPRHIYAYGADPGGHPDGRRAGTTGSRRFTTPGRTAEEVPPILRRRLNAVPVRCSTSTGAASEEHQLIAA